MATFPKPLCELKALWGGRGSSVSRPASCPAEPRMPSNATALPLAEKSERQALSKVGEATKNCEGE
jgi:hypothetical protein